MNSFMHNSLACELLRIDRAVRSFGRRQVFALLFLILPALLQARPIRVIDEAAIPFAGFLSKVDFDNAILVIYLTIRQDRHWMVCYLRARIA